MCGRLACVLEGNNLSVKCQYKDKRGEIKRPEWEGGYHTPGYNIPPTTKIPVLYSKVGDRVFRTMRWGMLPTNPTKKAITSTHNCRAETLLERPMYNSAFKRGQRCVIPANGFYEWNSTKGTEKIPYFVHHDKDDLLMIAGLYSKSKADNTTNTQMLYSATVITVNASKSINWLHHRMPALLQTEEEVQAWLHSGVLDSSSKLIPLLITTTCISLYPVDKSVNSVSTQGPSCAKRVEIKKRKSTTLETFFKKKQKTEVKKEDDEEVIVPRKVNDGVPATPHPSEEETEK